MDIGGLGEFSLIASIRRRMEGNIPRRWHSGSAMIALYCTPRLAWNG